MKYLLFDIFKVCILIIHVVQVGGMYWNTFEVMVKFGN